MTIVSYNQARVSSGSARLYLSSDVGRPSGPIKPDRLQIDGRSRLAGDIWLRYVRRHAASILAASLLDGPQQTRTRAHVEYRRRICRYPP